MPPATVPEPFMVRFLRGWNAPAERIEPHLGTPGYSLPDVSEFQWHPMPGTGPNNWVIAPPNMSGWANNRRFDLEPGATENVVVLGSELIGYRTASHLWIAKYRNPIGSDKRDKSNQRSPFHE